MIFPLGYRYASTYAGIRKVKKDDLALIVSDVPANAAATFTTNQVQAAPVRLAKHHLQKSGGKLRAILVNAGNANCATRTGDAVALATCKAAAEALDAPVDQILPASTGVIGVELDPKKITRALPGLVRKLSPKSFRKVAQAILTTDTRLKISSAEVAVRGGSVRIAGMTKGAGMIHPRMATTLAFVMTDAIISPVFLHPMLATATEFSFNRLTVDGDTSTNDILSLMANGVSGLSLDASSRPTFQEALHRVLQDLAAQIAKDGEGAQKRITIQVSGARTHADAARIARAIANSPLVKTAIAGSDPNWGRILCAAGNAEVPFDPSTVDISLQGVPVCRSGLAAKFSEASLKKMLDRKECLIDFRFHGKGNGAARFWTCDFTYDYIRINASYRT
ncbi:MAG: bifunctional glutamate N-acetyltransferase/amino-acid acetyltransferase ArgJ [Acidimicrobiia bacterium]|nr:bifunctional glutamate N-acetyltransferase/amino-acid acetyltransferase ArgJ [Acidimicrobiia bacterium]